MGMIFTFLVFILAGLSPGVYFGAKRPDKMEDASLIPFENRWKLLLWAWAIAGLATVLIEIPLLVFFPFFPLGLFSLLHGQEVAPGYLAMGCGWLIYIIITDAALLANKRFVYFGIYGVLCLLLILNVAGCHQILKNVQ